MTTYPAAVPTFTSLTDGMDDVLASHQNTPNAEITAIATELGTLPKGDHADVKTRLNYVDTGWTLVSGAWTYASANTINIPSDGTTVYKKGMGIRLKQGAGYKYYYITIVAATLLTVTGGTDYTVANAAITDIAFTQSPATAFGFPNTFVCVAPTWNTATIDNGTGGVQPTAGASHFSIAGNQVSLQVTGGSAGVVKTGAGITITTTALPATLPAMSETTLAVIGSCYAATVDLPGVALASSAAVITLLFSASIADNAAIPYTGFRVIYKY